MSRRAAIEGRLRQVRVVVGFGIKDDRGRIEHKGEPVRGVVVDEGNALWLGGLRDPDPDDDLDPRVGRDVGVGPEEPAGVAVQWPASGEKRAAILDLIDKDFAGSELCGVPVVVDGVVP